MNVPVIALLTLLLTACTTPRVAHQDGFPDCFYDPQAPCSVSVPAAP